MIRFGIVGAGGIAQKFVRDCKKSNAEIVAIASRSLDKAEAFKEAHDLTYAFGSYQEMADSNVIDAVYIATPHSHHMDHALPFLKAGKHVLVEKAITANQAQFERLVQAANEYNVLLMEAMWTRFLPSSQRVKEVSKTLGKLQHMELAFGYALLGNYPVEGRLLNPALAGGSILDIGVYPISFLLFIKEEEIKSIDATANLHETGVDIDCDMNVTFKDGSTAELHSSIGNHLHNGAIFTFEKGEIRMTDFSRSIEIFINGNREEIPFLGEGFVHQINSFMETVERGETENSIMTHEKSRKVMKFMDEVRRQVGVTYPFE